MIGVIDHNLCRAIDLESFNERQQREKEIPQGDDDTVLHQQ